jgi:L-seryl-tRNA(Ser) seleniumtransferase
LGVKTSSKADLFRKLPSVDELLRSTELAPLREREGQAALTDAARSVLERLRSEISAGRLDAEGVDLALSGLGSAVERQLRQSLSYSLRPVINATGVILHTNLGRAPLAESAIEHIRDSALTYSNLEFNVENGERGKRDVHVDRLFRRLLPSNGEFSTVVVNNNAAAVLLALNSLAEGGEVVVSRGELVEIGGSFRIPDVMTKSSAILREVGTTNRTRISDYERAITDKTRLLLRVHRSNFQITGFTEQPTLADLVELGQRRGIPVMEDLGSGALFDLQSVGVSGEPGVVDSIAAGVHVVTYSGDKLLGGPQAGILSGKKDVIARIRSNPLFRALRVDKLTYAALEATLLAYVREDHNAIPALRMMRRTKAEIAARAELVAKELEGTKFQVQVVDGDSVVGGGAAPGATLPTKLVAISLAGSSSEELAAGLRAADPPVIARIEEGRVLLDLRTVFLEQEPTVIAALKSLGR